MRKKIGNTRASFKDLCSCCRPLASFSPLGFDVQPL